MIIANQEDSIRLAAALLLLALPVQAETLSQEIAQKGLAATQARLLALTSPSDADRFALGGVTFLRAIEGTFQERYAMGLTDRMGLLPLLRLPLEDNPNPEPFQPAAITNLFTHAAQSLTDAQAVLASIPPTSDAAMTISLNDLWFDVDSNGNRSPGEGLTEILEAALGSEPGAVTVRFDVADAAWLSAYAHLLAGICDVVRAYDPTEPISRILAARQTIQSMGDLVPVPIFGGGGGGLDVVDLIAMVLASLNQQPDRALMVQAQGHLLSMVAQNREFWARVAVETDNDHEWLPNDAQVSALGIAVPQGTGTAWLAVLAEVEAALKGERLLTYWRVAGPAGINLAKMFTDPRPVDVAGWIQGWAALPYLEKGVLVSPDSMNAFDTLVGGQAPLFAIYLN